MNNSAVEIKLTENDVVLASKIHNKIPFKYVVRFFILVLVALAIAAVKQDWSLVAGVFGGVLGGLGTMFLFRQFLVPFLVKRNYRSYKLLQEAFLFSIEDKGVRFKTEDSDSLIRWDYILKWKENDQYIILYPAKTMFYIIPKSLVDSGLDLVGLKNNLEENVGVSV